MYHQGTPSTFRRQNPRLLNVSGLFRIVWPISTGYMTIANCQIIILPDNPFFDPANYAVLEFFTNKSLKSNKGVNDKNTPIYYRGA